MHNGIVIWTLVDSGLQCKNKQSDEWESGVFKAIMKYNKCLCYGLLDLDGIFYASLAGISKYFEFSCCKWLIFLENRAPEFHVSTIVNFIYFSTLFERRKSYTNSFSWKRCSSIRIQLVKMRHGILSIFHRPVCSNSFMLCSIVVNYGKYQFVQISQYNSDMAPLFNNILD